jgi:hypothetical protein
MRKALAAVLLAIIAVAAFSLIASADARPFMNWRTYNRMPGMMNRLGLQQSFVRVLGVATEWGTTDVMGALNAQSRTIVLNDSSTRQGSSATAIWTTNTSRAISAVRAKENFTYTFYTARLVEANVSALDLDGSNLFMNGTWNVFEVNSEFTVVTNSAGDVVSFHRDQNSVALATRAYGELKVTNSWANFTLTINGVDPLTGVVRVQRITTRMFNPFKVTDDSGVTVTAADLASVAKAYGAMPGWGNYDQGMDYNFDYKIDVTDLATCAANVNV